MSTTDDTTSESIEDPLDHIREREESVEALAERTDQLGAFARVLLARASGEMPAPEDLRAAGLDEQIVEEEDLQ